MNPVRSVIAGLNRNLPIFAVATMDELVVGSTASQRFEAALLTCFPASACCLRPSAAVGLYAALSEMVVRRTFEIGLRVALGAQQHDVFGLVVRRGLILAATGLVLGLAGFAVFGRVVAAVLYGVRTFDPFVVATACAVLLVVALLASTAPAWRAPRLEPTDALREQ
jgi:putative ABC transport system permease protein